MSDALQVSIVGGGGGKGCSVNTLPHLDKTLPVLAAIHGAYVCCTPS